MASYTTQDIRNITLVGHAGAGKTTLAERLLLKTDTIDRMGTIEDGNTVCDFESEEKEHGHSLSTAIIHFEYNNHRFNVIDTPGYPGFIGQSVASLAAAETACIVVDADKGIEDLTRKMMANAKKENNGRAILINKIDHHPEKLEELVESLQKTFGKECIPFNLPLAGGESVAKCFPEPSSEKTLFGSPEDANNVVVEQSVEVDDELMEKYLEEGEVTQDEMIRAFGKSMCDSHLVPIFFVSAKNGAGATEFLDAVAEFFPAPGATKCTRFKLDGEDWGGETDADKPFVGHVFRVTTDAFVGKLAAIRVHQGKLSSGDTVHLDDIKKGIRIAHFFQLQGKDHIEVHEAIPGDIVAVAKIDDIHYDAVIHEGLACDSIATRGAILPKPMFGMAITAAKRGEEGKIFQSFQRLADEDPTFAIGRDPSTHETVIRGNSDMHLRVMLERLKNRYNLEVNTAPPRIAYKETVSNKADGHHRHKKQSGGAGQFGEVFLRIEPLPRDQKEKFEFADETFGGSVPKQFMPAIEKGVKQVLEEGCVAGYPMEYIKVIVYDGKHHAVDSKEIAFLTAGKKAFSDAVRKARPVLLEPIVEMEITAPQEYMGDITGDISGRRGRIQGSDMLPGGLCVVNAVAPLGEVMTYANSLKAMTQGTGSYSMEYSHDDPTPANVQAEVVASYKPKADDD